MAFPAEATRVPTTIGPIVIILKDVNGTQAGKSVTYQVTVLDAAGIPLGTKQGNLIPQLTGTQITALSDFADAMRTKAAAEILP